METVEKTREAQRVRWVSFVLRANKPFIFY
jgi:hypothetical protein